MNVVQRYFAEFEQVYTGKGMVRNNAFRFNRIKLISNFYKSRLPRNVSYESHENSSYLSEDKGAYCI